MANSTQQTAYVATGSHGLAIIDASRFQNPIILGQIDLPSDARNVSVDARSGVAVVAGAEASYFVNVADPMLPTLARTVPTAAQKVSVVDGIAYLASGGSVVSYDVLGGELLQKLPLSASDLTAMARQERFLYVLDAAHVLRILQITNAGLAERGAVQLPQGGSHVFVDGNVAYVGAQGSLGNGSFSTVDVSNPTVPVLISGPDISGNEIVPGLAIVANGSGLAVAAGLTGASGQVPVISFVDVRDPSDTSPARYFTQYPLPSRPIDVAIASGIGYVTTGAGGLQVINYVGFDAQRTAPTISIASSIADADPNTDGVQVIEGTLVPIRPTVTDDVQVRNLELLVNGVVVANDVSAPFDFTAQAPALATASSFTVQARATDTGGNSALSNVLTFGVIKDNASPVLMSSSPAQGGAGFRVQTVTLRFDEAIDPAVLALTGFSLKNYGADGAPGGGDDSLVPLASVELLSPRRLVVRIAAPLGFGKFELTVQPTVISDIGGNTLAAPLQVVFTSHDAAPDNAVAWIAELDGDWNNPANWSTGQVPGPNDNVVINVINANPTVRITSGNVVVKSILASDALAVTGGSLTVKASSIIDSRFQISNGASLTADGSNALFVVNGDTNIDGGSLYAINGGVIRLPQATSYAVFQGALQASGAGSVLDLSGLRSIVQTSIASALNVEALLGGRVLLSSVTTMTSTDAGSIFGDIGILVTADGSGGGSASEVNLAQLTSFIDNSTRGYSTLTAKNGGRVVVNSTNTQLRGTITTVMDGGRIEGTLELLFDSTIQGNGTIQGSVLNRGLVKPGNGGKLTITGNYEQASTGTLEIEIGGRGVGVQYDQLEVQGNVLLDGTLNLTLINGFTPSIGDLFFAMKYANRTGGFAVVNGIDLGNGRLFDVGYNATDLALAVIAG